MMLLNMLKGKIHRAKVTEANLNYVGSITIDNALIEAAGILPGEKVQVVNNNNGTRLETYVIEGTPKSGIVCLNGAAARLVQPGDEIIIIAYCWIDQAEAQSFEPNIVFVDEQNRILNQENSETHGVQA